MSEFKRCKSTVALRYYNARAIEYAEEHGIFTCSTRGDRLVYYANHFDDCQHKEKYTVKVIVNLDTMKEESRTRLKRVNGDGDWNMYK